MSRAKVDDIVWEALKRGIDTIEPKIKEVQDGKSKQLCLSQDEFLYQTTHVRQVCDLIKQGNLQNLEIPHSISDKVVKRLAGVIEKSKSKVKVKIKCTQFSHSINLDLDAILQSCPNVECTVIKRDAELANVGTSIINPCKQDSTLKNPLKFDTSGESSDIDYTLDEDVPCAAAPVATVVIAGEQAPEYNRSNLDPEL